MAFCCIENKSRDVQSDIRRTRRITHQIQSKQHAVREREGGMDTGQTILYLEQTQEKEEEKKTMMMIMKMQQNKKKTTTPSPVVDWTMILLSFAFILLCCFRKRKRDRVTESGVCVCVCHGWCNMMLGILWNTKPLSDLIFVERQNVHPSVRPAVRSSDCLRRSNFA